MGIKRRLTATLVRAYPSGILGVGVFVRLLELDQTARHRGEHFSRSQTDCLLFKLRLSDDHMKREWPSRRVLTIGLVQQDRVRRKTR